MPRQMEFLQKVVQEGHYSDLTLALAEGVTLLEQPRAHDNVLNLAIEKERADVVAGHIFAIDDVFDALDVHYLSLKQSATA